MERWFQNTRGLVIVISDLIDDPAETLKALKLLAGHRHALEHFRGSTRRVMHDNLKSAV